MSPALLWAVVLMALPAAVAAALWSICGAITLTTLGRCRNPRPGPLHRCQHHRNAFLVKSDLYGALALAVALGGFVIWHEAFPDPVLAQLFGEGIAALRPP